MRLCGACWLGWEYFRHAILRRRKLLESGPRSAQTIYRTRTRAQNGNLAASRDSVACTSIRLGVAATLYVSAHGETVAECALGCYDTRRDGTHARIAQLAARTRALGRAPAWPDGRNRVAQS